ncbi:DUF2243 domain-containing protein [Aquisalibacillus elongatus]|uniref:Putative membrane protein n=1 Tax=Aquisalibacillus elongatus TaxID=485577 RepID=A0A3N5BJ25_9BACI|nr:DUF2243 domain-containing protein [Aquisalibacillus elongatus]RPF55280.1 putative membrane protein [Aquisalibacillus elongatus]
MTKENKNLFTAGFILGLGILGAIDGVVFHQLLQWHHMIMSPNIHLEIYTDGLFTAAFSALMVWGAIKIFRDAKKGELGHNGDIFLSGILIGGGVFNLVEGIIDHHILQVHRVNPMAENPLLYDLAFLASGVVLILIGLWLKKLGQQAEQA